MRRPDCRQLVDRKPSALSIRRQCALLGIAARDLVRQLDRQIPRPQDRPHPRLVFIGLRHSAYAF